MGTQMYKTINYISYISTYIRGISSRLARLTAKHRHYSTKKTTSNLHKIFNFFRTMKITHNSTCIISTCFTSQTDMKFCFTMIKWHLYDKGKGIDGVMMLSTNEVRLHWQKSQYKPKHSVIMSPILQVQQCENMSCVGTYTYKMSFETYCKPNEFTEQRLCRQKYWGNILVQLSLKIYNNI